MTIERACQRELSTFCFEFKARLFLGHGWTDLDDSIFYLCANPWLYTLSEVLALYILVVRTDASSTSQESVLDYFDFDFTCDAMIQITSAVDHLKDAFVETTHATLRNQKDCHKSELNRVSSLIHRRVS